MLKENQEIEVAISTGDINSARAILREVMNAGIADAETYYLASQVAVNEKQKQQFLSKAIELDPFHQNAHEQLDLRESSVPLKSDEFDFTPNKGTVENKVDATSDIQQGETPAISANQKPSVKTSAGTAALVGFVLSLVGGWLILPILTAVFTGTIPSDEIKIQVAFAIFILVFLLVYTP
jgi:predicted DNA-binding protein